MARRRASEIPNFSGLQGSVQRLDVAPGNFQELRVRESGPPAPYVRIQCMCIYDWSMCIYTSIYVYIHICICICMYGTLSIYTL